MAWIFFRATGAGKENLIFESENPPSVQYRWADVFRVANGRSRFPGNVVSRVAKDRSGILGQRETRRKTHDFTFGWNGAGISRCPVGHRLFLLPAYLQAGLRNAGRQCGTWLLSASTHARPGGSDG